MSGIIAINGMWVPAPQRGLSLITTTAVDSARNANAQVVGQKIGRDQYKLNALSWPWLQADQWASILQQFSSFFATVTFPDQVTAGWITLKMYPGDRSGQPYWIDPSTKLPLTYTNCKVNIIDTGW